MTTYLRADNKGGWEVFTPVKVHSYDGYFCVVEFMTDAVIHGMEYKAGETLRVAWFEIRGIKIPLPDEEVGA